MIIGSKLSFWVSLYFFSLVKKKGGWNYYSGEMAIQFHSHRPISSSLKILSFWVRTTSPLTNLFLIRRPGMGWNLEAPLQSRKRRGETEKWKVQYSLFLNNSSRPLTAQAPPSSDSLTDCHIYSLYYFLPECFSLFSVESPLTTSFFFTK